MLPKPARFGVRARLAVAADPGDDEVGPFLLQLLGPQAPLLQGAGPEVLQQNVGCLEDEPPGQQLAFPPAQVERDRLLVAGQDRPPEAEALGSDRPPVPHGVAGGGLLDLDDLGAEVAEQLTGERPGHVCPHLDDTDAVRAARPLVLLPCSLARRSGRRCGSRSTPRRTWRRTGSCPRRAWPACGTPRSWTCPTATAPTTSHPSPVCRWGPGSSPAAGSGGRSSSRPGARRRRPSG